MRTGSYIHLGSIPCFDPSPLPPDPPIVLAGKLSIALSEADRALARLDGATLTLPDPDLFVYAFMRQEAVLSSQIEGTQASLDDLLEFESGGGLAKPTGDVADVINYLNAMRWGLAEVGHISISLRLIREMHRRLLADGRGAERAPGEFRSNQNWIGPPGCRLEDASFVPPAVPLMHRALDELESFIHRDVELPPLIRFGLIHSQFETIHPFWDGNGRVGRMLVTLLMCEAGVLQRPVLYPSLYFKQRRQEYYDRLQAVRDRGDVKGWLIFFLNAITSTSSSALSTAQAINALRSNLLASAPHISRSSKMHGLIEALFRRPYLNVSQVAEAIGSTFPTANSLVADLIDADVMQEITGGRRDRIFAFKPYLDILHTAVDDLGGVIGVEDRPGTGPP